MRKFSVAIVDEMSNSSDVITIKSSNPKDMITERDDICCTEILLNKGEVVLAIYPSSYENGVIKVVLVTLSIDWEHPVKSDELEFTVSNVEEDFSEWLNDKFGEV